MESRESDAIVDNSLSQIRKHVETGQFSRAFPHFLIVAKLRSELFSEDDFCDHFLHVVDGFVTQLRNVDQDEKIVEVYNEALNILPGNTNLLADYGSHLFCQEEYEMSEEMFRRALKLDPFNIEAKDKLENLISSQVERWHFPMLNDVKRNTKFEAAISSRLSGAGARSGVLDVGTGTGLLALLAAGAGAESVTACEVSRVMNNIAKHVLTHNESGSNIRLIPKLSTNLADDEVEDKFSLIISETFDAGLLGEHILETVHHAHNHLMNSDCSIIPVSAKFFVVPVQSRHVSQHTLMDSSNFGFLNIKNRLVSNWTLEDGAEEPYQSEQMSKLPGGFKILSEPRLLFEINFMNIHEVEQLIHGKHIELEFQCSVDGDCDAVAGWFELHLDERNVISTKYDEESCWEQAIFPVKLMKRKVYKDTRINLSFLIRKHVSLQKISLSHNVQGNGVHEEEKKEDIHVSPATVHQLNSETRASISQWVTYYCVRDVKPVNILDLSLSFPDTGLQILKLCPHSTVLTMMINTERREEARKMLDLVTSLAADNGVDMQRISCITDTDQADDVPDVVIVAPVLASGRLNTNSLIQLSSLIPRCSNTLFLPHSLEVWVQVVESPMVECMARLTSDDKVLGLNIAQFINKLSVSHQQDIVYQALERRELCDPVLVTSSSVQSLCQEKQVVKTRLVVKEGGRTSCVLYWFVLDYGWSISENTRDSDQFNMSAVVISPHLQLQQGDQVEVRCHLEKGLVDFSLEMCDNDE